MEEREKLPEERLRELEEEDPQLHVAWDEHLQEIQVQLMGEVQIEVLKSLIAERFGVEVEFGTASTTTSTSPSGPWISSSAASASCLWWC